MSILVPGHTLWIEERYVEVTKFDHRFTESEYIVVEASIS